MGCATSKEVEAPPPISVPWKGIWKEVSKSTTGDKSVRGPLNFRMPRHNKVYIKRTMTVNFGTESIKVETGKMLLLKQSSDETLLGCAKKVGRNYAVYRPQRIFDQQPTSGKHQGVPYYLYATVSVDGSVRFNDQGGKAVAGNFENFELRQGPRNSFHKFCRKINKPHSFAEWKYDAQSKLHNGRIRGDGYDIGLLVLLVVIGDLQDQDAIGEKLNNSALAGV